MTGAPLPSSIKIGRHVYEVTRERRRWAEVTAGSAVDPDGHGGTLHHLSLIVVNPVDAPTQQADTLWHEIMHVAWFVSGVRIGDLSGLDGPQVEEYLVGQLSPWLVQTLVDNPELIEFLRHPSGSDQP